MEGASKMMEQISRKCSGASLSAVIANLMKSLRTLGLDLLRVVSRLPTVATFAMTQCNPQKVKPFIAWDLRFFLDAFL